MCPLKAENRLERSKNLIFYFSNTACMAYSVCISSCIVSCGNMINITFRWLVCAAEYIITVIQCNRKVKKKYISVTACAHCIMKRFI